LVLPVSADHAWGTYHWFRTANPVVLQIGDNVSGVWDSHLSAALSDWDNGSGSYNDVLDLTLAAGGTAPRRCRPTAGRVEVCNDAYGANGWLGVAQIWVSGDHITQATTKMNDTYFTDAYGYNTPAWRQMVMCQEVGHAWGLDHQDENFNNPNLGTCMDYTSDPSTNQHPNAHDFEQLEAIYTHLDSSSGGGGGGGRGRGAAPQLPPAASGFVPGDAQREWGTLVRASRRYGMFHLDLGGGQHVFTFVIWA
jgi:hypothetical protein